MVAPSTIRGAFRIVAWLLLAAITFVTLGPAQDRPQTNLGHNVEHAFAFVILGIAFAYGYAKWLVTVLISAVPAIGFVEFLQFWAPGRHARLEDFMIDLLAFWIAFAVSIPTERILSQTIRSDGGDKTQV